MLSILLHERCGAVGVMMFRHGGVEYNGWKRLDSARVGNRKDRRMKSSKEKPLQAFISWEACAKYVLSRVFDASSEDPFSETFDVKWCPCAKQLWRFRQHLYIERKSLLLGAWSQEDRIPCLGEPGRTDNAMRKVFPRVLT